MIATGTALIFTGWVLICPGEWKGSVGGFTLTLACVGSCLIAVGMLTVVQARN